MANIRQAQSSTQAPISIGEPSRPGQVEGGNNDPVIVSGEIETRNLDILKPKDVVKALAYRNETNEAVIIVEENTAYQTELLQDGGAVPSAAFDRGFVFRQSRILYYNGNTFMDVDDTSQRSENDDAVEYIPYKINDVAWRPLAQPQQDLDRPSIEGIGMEGSTGDIALMVGEQKRYQDDLGADADFGALLLFRPSLIGASRNLLAGTFDTTPIQRCPFVAGFEPDLDDVELYGVSWQDTFLGEDNMASFALGVAYVVGTKRVGTRQIPKAYKLVFNTSDGRGFQYYSGGEQGLGVWAYDLGIENVLTNGILYSCNFDDEAGKLYVTGTSFVDGNEQPFMIYNELTQSWEDKSTKINEKGSNISIGTDAYLIQDSNGIRLLSNTATFIKDGVNRGEAIWVDLADYNASGFIMDEWQQGLFFVRKVVSERELILDKKMPNKFWFQSQNGFQVQVQSSLFKWGYLQTAISDTDTTIVVDVLQAYLEPPAGPAGITFPAGGGTIYLDGEQITYESSTFVDGIYGAWGFGGSQYRRYTLANCVRGVNNTTPVPHIAEYIDGVTLPWARPHIAVLMETERSFRIFTKITDVKPTNDGASLFLTGDNALIGRYDISIDTFTDYREKNVIPSTIDFGRMDFKPDSDTALIIANTPTRSYVYNLVGTGSLKRLPVPTVGILNDVGWTPDGMSALIGGRGLYQMTRKINVASAQREPKTLPIRYLFNNLEADFTDIILEPLVGVEYNSDVLAIDDLDSDTLSLFIAADAPNNDAETYQAADIAVYLWRMFECQLRIYLSARGDETNDVRRSFWKAITVSDTAYGDNPNNFDFTGFTVPLTSTPYDRAIFRRMYKLPSWAKYIAADLIFRPVYDVSGLKITVGVQGGIK